MNPRQAPNHADRHAGDASTRGRLIIPRREPEPKTITLLWSLYLLVAAGSTVFAVEHLWIYDASDFRTSSRLMLGMIGLGVGALWPMVRLSQTSPQRIGESVFADVVAMCVPAQAVIWPLTLLGGWTWGVTALIALALGAWAAFIGAIMALGVLARPGVMRSAWMLVAIACVAGAPIWAMSTGWARPDPASFDWRFASPLTMGWGMTTSLNGSVARITPDKWAGVLIPAAAAAIGWAHFALASAARRATPKH
ncbi:MAG: hypothetical protein H6814_07585 [Phycisphaeraceae bacterium]|nr:hypothetical protein [Phycisphaeraceae bacterium]